MLFNPGSVINKFLKIFCNKKTNFYASKWGFSPLKILKNRELQGGFAPLTPQRGRCPCTQPGACGPLEPRLIYGVNSHRLYPSGFLVHPHFHPCSLPGSYQCLTGSRRVRCFPSSRKSGQYTASAQWLSLSY